MSPGTQRQILRLVHLIVSVPLLGYVYSPFEDIPQYAPAVRFFFLPVLVLTGLLLWQGAALRRWLTKRPTPVAST